MFSRLRRRIREVAATAGALASAPGRGPRIFPRLGTGTTAEVLELLARTHR